MSLVDVVFKDLLAWAKNVITRQWQGALIASIIWILLYLLFVKPTVDRFYDLGAFVGDFRITKGDKVKVSTPDLTINFHHRTSWSRLRRDSITVDTFLYYPQFDVYRDGRWHTEHERFYVGRRLGIATTNYYYTIELERLDETGADTVAHLKVYRREYPETRRDDK